MNLQQFTFGEIIKKEREKQKLSLRELAEMSNIEASYINRLEKGNRDNPGFSTVCALAKALKLNGDEIVRSFGYDHLGTQISSQKEEDIKRKISEEIAKNLVDTLAVGVIADKTKVDFVKVNKFRQEFEKNNYGNRL
ncbi:helix-turn-helix domain-containing protein [Fredinandcohnia sp. QZ13]|uniref:helix-turn-helix domain-containing protein n=1 Tax=Fredinandcohnia sp. QZ13 TaxID=3073144 RepID=UPI0028536912|nr:helix-turn-helix domain-containing protein [Fredinandcohnia sp. QZ13]MDR4887974.1 helix-turn-helix domain-containing protein [Fredinandcohnia sp. QZ13]